MRKAWVLVAAGGVLLVGPLVAVHWPAVQGPNPGQQVGLAMMAQVCQGALGQLAEAFSRSAVRDCSTYAQLMGWARAAEVVGVGALAVGGWLLYRRRAA